MKQKQNKSNQQKHHQQMNRKNEENSERVFLFLCGPYENYFFGKKDFLSFV